ncbi:hypothetical protein EVAR_67763_1 [Eumeta japonica]|uniref:Uncharacterized protein n=1 Tax=Eumeta variegata TaxID=151549 RepID=A0A4C2A9K3_EUMVA|nr:hypothetical protein EVAR_67763_1 [Eumeta japonica]
MLNRCIHAGGSGRNRMALRSCGEMGNALSTHRPLGGRGKHPRLYKPEHFRSNFPDSPVTPVARGPINTAKEAISGTQSAKISSAKSTPPQRPNPTIHLPPR